MKTIVIQLLECMVISEDEYYKMRDSGHTLDDYAPEGVYNYYKLGKRKIMAVLNSELLTSALIPMLREFYSVYGDKKYSQLYNFHATKYCSSHRFHCKYTKLFNNYKSMYYNNSYKV